MASMNVCTVYPSAS